LIKFTKQNLNRIVKSFINLRVTLILNIYHLFSTNSYRKYHMICDLIFI